MRWSNVRLILGREIRDQLRDRRTLFMIAVLPLLLYPLLGMSMFQMAQFVRESPTKIWVVGGTVDGWKLPRLFDGEHFSLRLFPDAAQQALLNVQFQSKGEGVPASEDEVRERAQAGLRAGRTEAVLYFPPDFAEKLNAYRQKLDDRLAGGDAPTAFEPAPSPIIYYNTAKEKSQIALRRTNDVLDAWSRDISRAALEPWGLPAATGSLFKVSASDVAAKGHKDAAAWAKVLPFMLLVWALTGAFYPAIDLCAGEKERGTLETLLSSPAERSEIVCGKLLTIMLFSGATAVLNLLALGFTGSFVIKHLSHLKQFAVFGSPPPTAALWLGLALIPVSALFGALCLALAAFARSTKEGQYYLMPLFMVSMPLMMLPLAPGAELTLGNALIPVTGLMLLLRGLLEGNLAQVLPLAPVVIGITLLACLASIRWAIDQFNSEQVLFRESERTDPVLWLKHLRRDREDVPAPAQAVLCGVLILVVQFFLSFALPVPADFRGFLVLLAVSQLVVIATPALLMTIILTKNVRQTLSLRWPRWWCIPAGALLAVVVHPVAQAAQSWVMRIYPISDQAAKALSGILGAGDNFWTLAAVFAIVPAICEELAFRGFILSGLRSRGHVWQAIAISSLFFGVTHPIMQQSVLACGIGLVIGFVAVRTGSLFVGIAFHMTHNFLVVMSSQLTLETVRRWPELDYLVRSPGETEFLYEWPIVVMGGLAALLLLSAFNRLPGGRESSASTPIEENEAEASVPAPAWDSAGS
jgi:sodium transport system permease protein